VTDARNPRRSSSYVDAHKNVTVSGKHLSRLTLSVPCLTTFSNSPEHQVERTGTILRHRWYRLRPICPHHQGHRYYRSNCSWSQGHRPLRLRRRPCPERHPEEQRSRTWLLVSVEGELSSSNASPFQTPANPLADLSCKTDRRHDAP
jgi:hypothetical protein